MVLHAVNERGGRSGYARSGPLSRAATEPSRHHLVNTACAMPSPWAPRIGPAQAYPDHPPTKSVACVFFAVNERECRVAGVPAGASPIRGTQGGGEPNAVLMRPEWPCSVVARESGPKHEGTPAALVNPWQQADI